MSLYELLIGEFSILLEVFRCKEFNCLCPHNSSLAILILDLQPFRESHWCTELELLGVPIGK